MTVHMKELVIIHTDLRKVFPVKFYVRIEFYFQICEGNDIFDIIAIILLEFVIRLVLIYDERGEWVICKITRSFIQLSEEILRSLF